MKHYNLQFKTMMLLYNIQRFVNIFNIQIPEHHKLWFNENFNLKYIDEIFNTQNYTNICFEPSKNYNELERLQMEFLGMSIIDNEDIDMEIKKELNDDDVYELENILQHKIVDGIRYYYVKWKGYPVSQNSWIPEYNFVETDILREYLEKLTNI